MSVFESMSPGDDNHAWLNKVISEITTPMPVRPSSADQIPSTPKNQRAAVEQEPPASSGSKDSTLASPRPVTGNSSSHDQQRSAHSVASKPGTSSSTSSQLRPETWKCMDPAKRKHDSDILKPPDLFHHQPRPMGSLSTIAMNPSAETLTDSMSRLQTPPDGAVPDDKKQHQARRKLYTPIVIPIPRPSMQSTRSFLKDFSKRAFEPSNLGSDAGSEFSGFESHPGVRPLWPCQVVVDDAEEVASMRRGDGSLNGDGAEYPGPLPLALIVLGICLSVFVISLDRGIITTAIPDITADFHSYSDIGWYGSAYLLTASAFQPLYGRIYMSFQSKSSFLGALAVFEAGSLLAALCPSSNSLIVARAIQGLGSAGLLTGAFVVGTHSVRLQHRPVLFAGVGILYGVGALTGPLLGGALTDTIGWRWCFWINLPIGAITFFAVLVCFKNKSANLQSQGLSFKQRVLELDIVGNIIILGAITMLVLALQIADQRTSWSNAPCIGLLCGSGATILVFIAWMWYRGDAALIPPRILTQHRPVAASCGAAFFIYGALLVHSYYLPIWFQATAGDSAIHSGVNMIPYMCANAVFSLLAGVFVSKTGMFAQPSILGCAVATVGSGFLYTLKPTSPASRWIGFEILISIGLGTAIQQGFNAVQTCLPVATVPIGTAAVVAAQSLGGAIFVSVGNTILASHLLNGNSVPGVDVRAVIQLGATRFRDVVPPEDLPALVHLYADSLRRVFLCAVPLCGLAMVCSLFMLQSRGVKKGSGMSVHSTGEKVSEEGGSRMSVHSKDEAEDAREVSAQDAAEGGEDGGQDAKK